jgi:flagellar hook-associated protein 2
MYKIKSSLSAYQGTANESIDLTQNKMSDLDDEISTLEDKLDDMAERYYNKFSAMETALSTLNSQASYISSLFGS